MDALYSSKNDVDETVHAIAKGALMVTDMDGDIPLPGVEGEDEMMGADDMMGDEMMGADDMLGDELPGDEFAGAEAAAGPEDEPLGRVKMESAQALKQKMMQLESKLNRAKAKK